MRSGGCHTLRLEDGECCKVPTLWGTRTIDLREGEEFVFMPEVCVFLESFRLCSSNLDHNPNRFRGRCWLRVRITRDFPYARNLSRRNPAGRALHNLSLLFPRSVSAA